MKKKVFITLVAIAAVGAAVADYLHFSGSKAFGHGYSH